MGNQRLFFEQYIQAPVSQIYNAFTNSSTMREWLCDISTADPKTGGRLYLAWHSDYYACGEYLNLEPDACVSFTWRGKDDLATSEVQVRMEAQNGGSRLKLEHIIPGDGEAWAKMTDEIERGWRDSLENLASVLETGFDLRFVRRPMLGIAVSDFNAEIASNLGVPVNHGMRLDSVVQGMGAHAAGLQAGDVIVQIDGFKLTGFVNLPAALAGKRAGDRVEVVYFRGPIEMHTIMELSQRPLYEIPASPAELVEAAKKNYEKDETVLQTLLADLSEEQADWKPAPEEWNVKEILAHLIIGERGWQNTIAEIVSNQESQLDDWGGNLSIQVAATVEAHPTLADLMEAYRRAHKETLALYARLPQEFLLRKGSYWRIAFSVVDKPTHFDAHLEQIQTAITTSRQ